MPHQRYISGARLVAAVEKRRQQYLANNAASWLALAAAA
jgi:hypothetical protein